MGEGEMGGTWDESEDGREKNIFSRSLYDILSLSRYLYIS